MAVADSRVRASRDAQFAAQSYSGEYFSSAIKPKTYVKFKCRAI